MFAPSYGNRLDDGAIPTEMGSVSQAFVVRKLPAGT
jgi:hypothetical protein